MTSFDSSTIQQEHRRFASKSPTNAMTVDVEDYFQVSAFDDLVRRDTWQDWPLRVQANTERILDIFAQHDVVGTFFTLGWIAEKCPQLIRDIVRAGHEIASHGYNHVRITTQTPKEFREDVTRTKAILEDIAGVPIIGYRAASYSVGEENLWALDILQETGHLYSSSIYPIKHDLYGMPSAPRFAFRVRQNALLEVPVSTLSIFGKNIPCGGGGFFRLYPYAISRWAIRRINQMENQPTVFYFHPWEIDPRQPRMNGVNGKTRFRHYLNLTRMQDRLHRLSSDFKWNSMQSVYGFDSEAVVSQAG